MAQSRFPSSDAAGGILVPNYEELTNQSAAPAAPAAGKTRLYVDSNGLFQLLPSSGATRRIATYLGSGTTFPAGAVAGDSCVRTDIGTGGSLWFYNGTSWHLTSGLPKGLVKSVTVTASTAIPAAAATTAEYNLVNTTFTAEAGRNYKFSFYTPQVSGTLNERAHIWLYSGETAGGALIGGAYFNLFANGAPVNVATTFATATAGSKTMRVGLTRDVGTNSCTAYADAAVVMLAMIEDLGAV